MAQQFPTRRIATLGGHNGHVHAVTYSAGLSQYILTGSTDRTIRLFNPARASDKTNGLVQTYSAHGYEVLDLAVADDNARFVSVGGDKTVFLWDVSTAKTLRRWMGHAGRVNACAFGGTEDSVVVSGSYDSTVKLWDAKSHSTKPLMTFSEAKDSISSVAVIGEYIMTGSIDGRLRTYDLRRGIMHVDVIGQPITSLTPTKQNDSILVSSLDSTIRLMDGVSGKLLKAYKADDFTNDKYRIRSTLGLNDNVVISGNENGQIFVWDVLEGIVRHKLRHSAEQKDDTFGGLLSRPGQGTGDAAKGGRKAFVSAVVFCGARKEWASAGGDGTVVVWSD